MRTPKPNLEKIAEEHGVFVRRTLAQLGVHGRDISDVAQEVFRGIYKRVEKFDPSLSPVPETAFRGWIFGICERQAANSWRLKARRQENLVEAQLLDLEPSEVPSTEETMIAQERHALLMKLLAQVEPVRRAVLIAYELDNMSMVEIADELSIPVNTGWNRLRLAREDIRAAWKRYARRNKGKTNWAFPITLMPKDIALQGHETILPIAHKLVRQGVLKAQALGRLVLQKCLLKLSVAGFVSGGVGLSLAGALLVGFLWLKSSETPAPSTPNIPSAIRVFVAENPHESPPPPAEKQPPPGPPLPSALPVSEAAPIPSHSANSPPQRYVAKSTTKSFKDPTPPTQSPCSAPHCGPELELEFARVQAARAALEKGDVARATLALDAHRKTYSQGQLTAEREILAVRLLLSEGRRNEAKSTVKRFLSDHPDTPFRNQLEMLVASPKRNADSPNTPPTQ